ncbi:MAG: phosphoserine phosphatase SerB [Rhodobiaceae bacterium]|nr:phosphoserine phosphatase SerB [Rhodobiaceae bacterium]
MQHVCVLISKPGSGAITDAVVAAVGGHSGVTGPGRWLCPNEAWETGISLASDAAEDFKPARDSLADEIRDLMGGAPVDVAIVPAGHRRKRLLIADMDSTMIEQECIDELAGALGLKERVAAITERAMRGEIAFEPAVRERVGLLKGLTRDEIGQIADARISLMPGACTLVRTMRASGAYTALVSGGFTIFTSRIARIIGFDMNRANELLFEDDRLTGAVAEPILGQDAKRQTLLELVESHGLDMAETLAVGDGANDLAMIRLAGTGVAYRAKPAVAAAADVRIDHGDLTALLYLQGYTSAEFTG